MDRTEVRLSQVVTSTESASQLLELSEVEGSPPRTLTMLIGRDLARVISGRVRGVEPLRPLTHDLMQSMLTVLDARIAEVVIRDVKDGTYFATLLLQRGDNLHELDARPSDAIALAFSSGAPIFVSDRVWAQT